MDDRIHEPYRLPAIPGAIAAKHAALDCGRDCRQPEWGRAGHDRLCNPGS